MVDFLHFKNFFHKVNDFQILETIFKGVVIRSPIAAAFMSQNR